MDLDWQYISLILALVGAIYGGVLYEQRRTAKNIHQLRTLVQRIVLVLATKGIVVRFDEDDKD